MQDRNKRDDHRHDWEYGTRLTSATATCCALIFCFTSKTFFKKGVSQLRPFSRQKAELTSKRGVRYAIDKTVIVAKVGTPKVGLSKGVGD